MKLTEKHPVNHKIKFLLPFLISFLLFCFLRVILQISFLLKFPRIRLEDQILGNRRKSLNNTSRKTRGKQKKLEEASIIF